MHGKAGTPIPGAVEVIALARRVVSAMSGPAWRGSKVQVALQATQAAAWAACNERRLAQALVNLLHSAVRHTPPGGLIFVSVESQDETIIIRVQYTSEGFHAEDTRLKKLVEAMGGEARLESIPGAGRCFAIRLPTAANKAE